MSRLEELIQELCPDGVKFYPLGQVAHYSKRRIDASQVDNTTYVSVENLLQNKQGKTTASFVPETGAVIAFDEGDILIGNIRPYLRKIWLADCCGGTNGDVLAIQIKDKATLTPKFLYYILSSEDFFRYDIQNSKGAKMPRGSKEAVLNYQVPIPPLPVQAEIVRILDNFTERTTELAEQLTAELTARKKQYEYYRDKLLTFGVHGGGASDAVWRTLADLGKWSGGKTPSMSEHDYWAAGKIPWLTSKDMKCSTLTDTQDHITEIAVKNASMTLYPKNSIAIVTRSGILKHTFPVAYVPFSTTVNQDIKVLEVNETVIPRYAFHLLQGKGQDILARTKKQGGTVDSLDFQKLLTYRVPVPPLSIQQRIVNVLDNFDAVCTDLKISLPAEIEARQKQYEYYRDLLLSFDDCSQLVHVEREREREAGAPGRN